VVADLVVESVYVVCVEEVSQDYQHKCQTTGIPVCGYLGEVKWTEDGDEVRLMVDCMLCRYTYLSGL
jgi:hypothetical protein